MGSELRHFFFPYCIKRVAPDRYILLNRKYKPLGNLSSDWVNYETDPSVVHMKLSPSKAAKLSYDSDPDIETIYLYDDGCIPTTSTENMKAYLARLTILMSTAIKLPVH